MRLVNKQLFSSTTYDLGMDFVCKLNENNYLPKCRNDFDPVMMGYDEVCLRMYTGKKPFTEAEKICERDGSNLVHIKNEQEQTAFNQVYEISVKMKCLNGIVIVLYFQSFNL